MICLCFLLSNSSHPEVDDGDDPTTRDFVSPMQRRASLSSLQQGREPEELSSQPCGLGLY